MEKEILVALIEDDATIREGYAYLIGQAEGFTVVGAYGSIEDALKKIGNHPPDVLLLDVELPGVSGIEALPKLKKVLPDTQILILTVYEEVVNMVAPNISESAVVRIRWDIVINIVY
jgi:DNA-binding NarL/FixJ family response regulator